MTIFQRSALLVGAFVAASLAAVSLSTETASAGALRGALSIPRDAQPTPLPAEADLHYWRVWNGFLQPRPLRFSPPRELTVVLVGDPQSEEPIGCDYTLRGGALSPRTIVAKVGQVLHLQNHDGCSHFLYAEGVDLFNAQEIQPGMQRAVPMESAGSWPVADAVHPHVRGHLHALPDLVACGELGDDGRYVFRDVPAGSYTLRVFQAEAEIGSREVTIPGADDLMLEPIHVDLTSER